MVFDFKSKTFLIFYKNSQIGQGCVTIMMQMIMINSELKWEVT